MKIEFTAEEEDALADAERWIEECEGKSDWREMDEGYVQTIILANLIKRLLNA